MLADNPRRSDLDFFHRSNGALHAESVDLARIADEVGTPCYVYSRAAFEGALRAYQEGLQGCRNLVCYAVKANPTGALLRLAADLGCGADVTSGGELAQALRGGIPADRIVFSGVGKTDREIQEALEAGILGFNIESESELDRIDHLAREGGQRAAISFRINPDIDAQTHPKITTGLRKNKFGIPTEQALELAQKIKERAGVELIGLDCHVGSSLQKTEPLIAALDKLLELRETLVSEGFDIRHLDLGGGLGIPYYEADRPEHPRDYAQRLRERLDGFDGTLIVEPGRSVSGPAGVLLTSVVHTKDNGARKFAIVDAAMTDLVRPAMYDAHHEIEVLAERPGERVEMDVVGGVCESSDTFARQEPLTPLVAGDRLALLSAGAYGFAMASQYNGRPRAAEVLVEGDRYRVIRRRETYEDLWVTEVE